MDAHKGFVRIGTWTSVGILAIVGAISVGSGFLLMPAISQLGPVLTGGTVPMPLSYIAGVLLMAALIGPVLFRAAGRSLHVDFARRRVRAGFRTARFDEVTRAWRQPGPVQNGSFLVRFAVPGGPDARIPLSRTDVAPLSAAELEALLAFVSAISVEPQPDDLMRPPLGTELGPRTSEQRVLDRVGDESMEWVRVSYTQPVLVAEVTAQLERRRAADSERRARGLPAESSVARSLAAFSDALGRRRGAPLTQEPDFRIMRATDTPVVDDHQRGFQGSGSRVYRARLAEVMDWSRSSVGPGPLRALGILLLVVALVTPWLALVVSFMTSIVARDALGASYAVFFSLFFSWPLVAWVAVLLIWWARVRRFAAVRAAAVKRLLAGDRPPDRVANFFGAPYPEVLLARNVHYFLIAVVVILLVAGGVFIALGHDRIGPPYSPEPWHAPFGLAILAIAVIVFVTLVRSLYSSGIHTARARAEWRMLAKSAGKAEKAESATRVE